MKLKPEDNLNAWQDAAGKDPIDIDMEPPAPLRKLTPDFLSSLPHLSARLVLLIVAVLVLIAWAGAGSDGLQHEIKWLFWGLGHSIRFTVLLSLDCLKALLKGLAGG